MLKIYYTLTLVFKLHYINRNEEYKKGFMEAIRLLKIGMNRHPQYNAHVECDRLEKEKLELQKSIRAKDKEIKALTNRIKEKSLYARTPTQLFMIFDVNLASGGEFTLVANMSKETFYNMCTNFGARFTYQDADEAKGMMLQYINSKSAQGFKAYKDEKTAIKEGAKIKRI